MICLGKDSNTNLSDLRESFEEQKLYLSFQNQTKTQVFELIDARGFESMLFEYSITQDNVVDTLKFTSAYEAWNNLYTDVISRR